MGCLTTTQFVATNKDNIAAKVVTGQSVAGVAGTATVGSSSTESYSTCTSDGQTGCVTDASYPAAKVANISTWDLRAGQTIAGLTGALKTNCRNTVNSTFFNYDGDVGSLLTTGVTTGTAFDYWDTIDDINGFAPNRVTDWSANTVCDSSAWTDVTTNDGGTSHVACGTGKPVFIKV